jgi:BirA family transcriptional regulator, biotin operon repressor / biotin---[acetyl-CoA-carboxylase] ligase
MAAVKRLIQQPVKAEVMIAMRADVQTGGIGQRGRVWHSPEGGLWMTVAMREQGDSGRQLADTWRSLAIGVEVARELTARWPGQLGERLKLKWPNDLVIHTGDGTAKCGGILCERAGGAAGQMWWVVGLGINVNNDTVSVQQQTQRRVCSLREAGCRVDQGVIEELFVTLAGRIAQVLNAASFASYRASFEGLMWGRGLRDAGGKLEVVGIDEMGRLLVRDDAGEVRSVVGFEWERAGG